MSDRIADIVRRDLDALPVLPQDRWLPPKSGSRRAWSALFLGIGALAVLTAAVVVGGALRASRSTALESVPPASRATTAPSLRITRQDVLARGQTLAARVDRIEAKLIGRDQLDAIGFGAAQGELFWVVAISGDVSAFFGSLLPSPSEIRHGVYLYDARSGLVVAGTAGTDYWPSRFDRLRDESLAADSRTFGATVVELRLPDIVVVRAPVDPGANSTRPLGEWTLRADADTAYTWTASFKGGNAFSLTEMSRFLTAGIAVEITIAGAKDVDGTYRLEHIRNFSR